MVDTSNDDQYYTAAEVAKIKGIRRQSVIDGCKRGQYPGAYKTVPDAMNRQGIWRVPKGIIDAASATQDIVPITRPLTPADLQAVIQQSVQAAIDERMGHLEKRLENHDRLLMETLRAIQVRNTEAAATKEEEEKKKPWFKFW